MRRALIASALVTFTLAACGDDSGDDPAGTTPSTTAASTTAAPATAATATTGTTATAPRLESSVTLAPDGRPRASPTDAVNEVAIGRPADSADGLAAAIAQRLTDENAGREGFRGVTYGTTEVRRGLEVEIELRVDGVPDDAIAGWDYVVSAELRPSGWQVTTATRAAICRRSVSNGVCV